VAAALSIPCFEPDIVMEGGALEVNGKGTLLTTESCLLNPNRNPHLSKPEIEECLKEYLGIQKVLWLARGITGDDTDGHIDDLARFVRPDTVVTVVSEDPLDPDYEPLMENLRRLEEMHDQDRNPLSIVKLPMPTPRYYDGTRLPCSYANFYIGNRVVLLPTFDCPADEEALSTLQALFPARRVIGLDCIDLAWGFGALHCITQQQPAV
jgi:agmatine deiminase